MQPLDDEAKAIVICSRYPQACLFSCQGLEQHKSGSFCIARQPLNSKCYNFWSPDSLRAEDGAPFSSEWQRRVLGRAGWLKALRNRSRRPEGGVAQFGGDLHEQLGVERCLGRGGAGRRTGSGDELGESGREVMVSARAPSGADLSGVRRQLAGAALAGS